MELQGLISGEMRSLLMWWVVLAGALFWDFSWGEMPVAIHPVVWMGKPMKKFKAWGLNRAGSPKLQFFAGLIAALCLPLVFGGFAAFFLYFVKELGSLVLEIFMSAFLLKSTFAHRALGQAGARVAGLLAATEHTASSGAGALEASRGALRSLCSRSTDGLSSSQVASAAVSSLAENLADSVIAPLFFYALFGIEGAVCYRAVNTMDAILGYRGPLEHLGKAAARLDDIVNWIPARITCMALVLASPPRLWGHMLRVVRRSAHLTPSPNGGWPMAAMAGALGVNLEKVGVYRLCGEAMIDFKVTPREVTGLDIQRAGRLNGRALGFFLFGLAALSLLSLYFMKEHG